MLLCDLEISIQITFSFKLIQLEKKHGNQQATCECTVYKTIYQIRNTVNRQNTEKLLIALILFSNLGSFESAGYMIDEY